MGTIDLIILACFLPAVVIGLKDGIVRQIVALAALVLGLYLSVKFSATMGHWITERWHLEPFWVKVLSFSVIFIAVALVLNLLGKLLEKVIKITMLGWLNRLLGLVFALITTALIVGTLIYVLNSANGLLEFIPEERIAESRLYKPLLHLVETVFPHLKSLF